MGPLNSLENALLDVNKSLPELPKNAKKVIVQFLPWLTLLVALVTLWMAYGLWHWARVANTITDWANSISAVYGGTTAVSSRFTAMVWVSLAVLVAEAVIYLLAFLGLKDNKKSGWNMLFLAGLINVVYGIIVMFTSYGSIMSVISSVIGTAIGYYFLFQIREYYLGKKIEDKVEEPKEQ